MKIKNFFKLASFCIFGSNVYFASTCHADLQAFCRHISPAGLSDTFESLHTNVQDETDAIIREQMNSRSRNESAQGFTETLEYTKATCEADETDPQPRYVNIIIPVTGKVWRIDYSNNERAAERLTFNLQVSPMNVGECCLYYKRK